MLVTGAKIQYFCTIVRVEELRQFYSLSADVEGANPLNVEDILLELALYVFPVNSLSKQKRVVRCRMRKPRGL